MLATVFRPMTWRGRANSTRGNRAACRKSASLEMPMPGQIAPPRYSPFGVTTSKVVAVPKSTTTRPWRPSPNSSKPATALTMRSAPTSRGFS